MDQQDSHQAECVVPVWPPAKRNRSKLKGFMDTRGLLEIIRPVDGWLFDGEAILLHHLANRCSGKGCIVEIGSWKGKSTICLAKGTESGSRVRVYAIDPHAGSAEHHANGKTIWTYDEFKQNVRVAGVEHLVVPILKTSVEAARDFSQAVELLFIDGAHDYESVRQDFEAWSPKMVEGGVIAFHDTTWPGPGKVVMESLFTSRHFRRVRFVNSITYGTKVNRNSLLERLRNRAILCAKLVHDPLFMLATRRPVKRVLKAVLGK